MEYCSAQIVKPDSSIQIKEIVIYICTRYLGFLLILNDLIFKIGIFSMISKISLSFQICEVMHFCLTSSSLKIFKEQHFILKKNREYKARNMKCVNCVAFFGVEINGKNGAVIVEMGVPKFCAPRLEPDLKWVEISSEGVFQSS